MILAEKDQHPRFHIGESLLPMNLPILEQLGVLPQIAAIGVRKCGADFPSRNGPGYSTFRFANALTATPDHAFQVKREEFDEILFRNAAANGVTTHENTRIERVVFDALGVRARAETGAGAQFDIHARYLIDATGRDTLLGSALGLKRKHRKHQSAALYAHFRGVERRPGSDQGNISIYRFAHGWIWMIPLRDEVMSVGVVCWPDYLRQRRGRGLEFLLETLHAVPEIRSRMPCAQVIGPMYVSGNYSYECQRMSGERWLMVGDAFAFIDPIFSSGVFLAMNSAVLAADVVDGSLREPARESALQQAYGREIRRGLGAFSWFIFRFTAPSMRHLFANPRNVFKVEQALISLLAGDVFRKSSVPIRLLVFKMIYVFHALRHWRSHFGNYWRRRRQARAQFAAQGPEHDAA